MVLKETSIQSNGQKTPAIFKMYVERFIKGRTQMIGSKFCPFKGSILIMSGHCDILTHSSNGLLIFFCAKSTGGLECIKHAENLETLLNNGSISPRPKIS